MSGILKLEAKNLIRNRAALIVLGGLFTFFLCDWIYYFIQVFDYANQLFAFDSYTVVFSQSQKCSLYLFFGVLFVSYEYFYLPQKCNIRETLKATCHGTRKPMLTKVFITCAYILVFTFICIIFNCLVALYFGIGTAQFILNIVFSCFINYFSCSIMAMFIGIFASTLHKKVYGYVVLLLSAILFSGIVQKIADVFLFSAEINIYPIAKLFDIFPPNLNTIFNFSFGLSVLPYRVFLIAFWISFFIVLMKVKERNKNGKTIFSSVVSIVVCFSMLFAFYMPSSKVIRNNDPGESNFHDYRYYSSLNTENEDTCEEFNILTYDMNLKIVNELIADVKVKFTKNESGKYIFTLYHGYKISHIYNCYGEEIKYKRSDDHIYVDISDSPPELLFTYKGYSPQYYSNIQGICLPAGFAFYPIAGYVDLYNVDEQCFISCLPNTSADYHVKVSYIGDVFSNFGETTKNSFAGESNGLSLISGFYKSVSVNDTIVVYPYLCGDYKEESIRVILNEVNDQDAIKNKTIIVTPNVNQNSHYIFADDHIVAHGSLGIIDDEIKNDEGAIANDNNR